MNEKMHIFWLVVALVVSNLWAAVTLQAEEPALTETFDNPTLPDWEHSANAQVLDGVLHIKPDGLVLRAGELEELSRHTHKKLH